ncbi:hypothetical protein AVEN_63567-1 [Araneus ventricosus]|uniref:Mos1 transposase HTH domain-containing protein n=1 Tax=Araneus ventricosus TaxID=182803 RepID=A0A4Y2QQ67_ARAVE|nr:hypothetical protein AVEN_63567-1 [Araneus ventricosus]
MQQTAVPEFSLVQISMAENRGLKTWSQMEVRAVMRYEWVCGTSSLDIHRRLQSVYGDGVMSRQMVESKNKIPDFSDMHTDKREGGS